MADSSSVQILPQEEALSKSSLSSTKSDLEKSNKDITEEMATAFSKYVNFSVDKEENKFQESVEQMLTKLDEFFSLVDMIRSDTSLCLSSTMPDILAKCREMEETFEKIDKLEEFVNLVRGNISAMEAKVVQAETELGGVGGGLVKKLTSLVSSKKTKPRPTSYIAPKIFHTSDYFCHSSSGAATSTTSPSSASSASGTSLFGVVDDMDCSDLLAAQTS